MKNISFLRKEIALTLLPLLLCLNCAPTENTNPNHLEPVRAYDPLLDGYTQTVFASLIGKTFPELWMVCTPSFSREYAVILRSEPVNSQADNPGGSTDRRKWTLELATAAEQIWHHKEYPKGYKGPMELDHRKDVRVDRKRIEIDQSLAQELKKCWMAALRKTRYPDKDYRGADGATYQFYCDFDYFGETWSPTTGVPANLVALADRLGKLVRSAPNEREALIKDCAMRARQLQADARKSK
ncbi:MAG: hypothetical protein HZA91_21180 [Verrucomicrobia bacterium]|nr:hypothetical protein [Verrucomicrobiota bacterium]